MDPQILHSNKAVIDGILRDVNKSIEIETEQKRQETEKHNPLNEIEDST